MPNAQHPEVKADYAGDAYRACLAGRADSRQQRSCASAIILLNATKADLLEALRGAFHALRSYQYGNSAPDLAEGIADACERAISRATGASS